MNRIHSLATKSPLTFGLIVTILFILLVLISSIVVGAKWIGGTSGWYIGSTIGRLVSIFILLLILLRLGWLHSAGFTRLGQRRTWLILLLPLAYLTVVSAYAMTGNLDFSFSDPALTGLAALFLMSHAFLEETAFRGVILHGFVRAWGGIHRGLIESVLISSLFFGGYHILYLAGEALPVVLLRIVFATFLGVFLGAQVMNGKSIYPAVFFHGILNLAGYLNLTSNGMDGTTSSWLLLSLFMLPLALYGWYLIRDVSRYFSQSNSSVSNKYPAR
jgi:membrane protease YdiL (CAAX protease family)